MDGPVDFTLEHARLINAQPLGNFDGSYASDTNHSSTLGRNGTGGANIQDLARVGTPSSMAPLGQYPGRFIPPSLPLTTPGYMMSSFLSGGGAVGDHLKSLMPDLQQYWGAASHGDGCARYIVNNNTIYSPYLPCLPATESLSLFAHNVGVSSGMPGQAQINAYHRIHDLHKESLFSGAAHVASPAGLFGPVTSGMSPPSSRVTSENVVQPGNSSVKKESNIRHVENKRSSDSSKHSARSTDSHSKSSQPSSKHSKEHDKRTERKQDKNEKLSDSKQQNQKNNAKSDSGKEPSVNHSGNNSNVVKKQKQTALPSVQEENKKEENKTTKNNKNISETINTKSTDTKQETKLKNSDNKERDKEQTTIPTLTTVTLTSGESVTSPQLVHSPSSSTPSGLSSPPVSRNGISPDAVNGKPSSSMAQTSTTFSLPYYHAIYSHSQPSGSPEGKKVHAPTFTPEIGTLPSVVSVATLPVQTTACDMRIKKEKISYTCCKEKCVAVVTSNTNTMVAPQPLCTIQSPFSEKSECTQKQPKKSTSDTKDGKVKKSSTKSQDKVDITETSVASIKPVVCNTNKITVHPVKSSGSSYKHCKVSGTSSLSKNSQECDIKVPDEKEEKEGTVKPILGVKCKKADTSDAEKQGLTSHTDHVAIKGADNCDSKLSSNGDLLGVNNEKTNIISPKSHPSGDKKEGKLLKLETDSVARTMTDSVLHKKNNDIKCSSRKVKSMSTQSGVQLSKSKDFKHVPQSKIHEKSIRPREVKKGDNHNKDESLTTGMNIPIGIAVAQKREELKEENADQSSDTPSEGTRNNVEAETHNAPPLHRGDGQPSAFAGPIVSKSSSPNVSVTDMRNTLPANLIVTGSANGAGIAWSDDPSARHFTNPWLPSGHGINPSTWLGQMPFTIPPNIPTSGVTDASQLPVSVPPGFKLVQDSVTGQLMIIPASNLDMFDPNRLWAGAFPSSGHPGTFQQLMAVHQQQTQLQQQVLAQHQERQPTAEFAMLQQYQHQYQHLYQPRPDTASSDVCMPSTLQHSSVIEQSKASTESITSSKEIQSLSKSTGPSSESNQPLNEKDKTAAIVSHQSIQELNISSNQPLPYQYPSALPIVYNTASIVQGIPVSLSDNVTVKTEASTVQSRGTSPMVPASEIDDTSQETIDAAPSTTESSCDTTTSVKDAKTVTQSIASVQTCVTDVSCCTLSVTSLTCSNDSVNSVQKCASFSSSHKESKNEKSESTENNGTDDFPENKVNDTKCCEPSDIQNVIKETTGKEHNIETTDTSLIIKLDDKISIIEKPERLDSDDKDVITSTGNSQTDALSGNVPKDRLGSSVENYNPFLDPQILQAADGLELLSTLAEKRSKCLQVEDNKTSTIENVGDKQCEKTNTKSSPHQQTPKPKKKPFSRTRSVPAKCETKSEQPGSYYTSTGLRIPQGEEEINAIELDMRIRLAELQRLYKEKQRQLARLHPKKEKQDLSKRGPGRPRKRTHSGLPKKEDTPVKIGPNKGKDATAKKKKQAEALVDRVFRKTGGGFGMPLSKKLKANAMAALFKTQSGFTVKRKGSATSNTLAKSCDAVEMHQKVKKISSQKQSASNKILPTDKGNSKSSQQLSIKDLSTIKKQNIVSKGSKFESSTTAGGVSGKKGVQKKQQRQPDNVSDTDNGLGMLAKYATSALAEQPPPTKKPKKKKEEGVCTTSSIPVIAPCTNQNEPVSPCKEQASTASALPSTNVVKPAGNIKRELESDASPDNSSSGNKKRKPGRPRKCNPTPGVTETIVARNSKNFRFYQFQSFEDVAKSLSPPPERKQKPIDSHESMKPLHLDWLLRRSERIFLSEPSPQPSPNNNNTKDTPQKSPGAQSSKRSPSTSTTSVSTAKSKSEKAKLQKAKNIQELTQKVKRKYSKQALQNKTKSKDYKQKPKKRRERVKESGTKTTCYDSDSSSGSEGDNIPLSVLRERPSTPEPRSCVIDKDELKDGLRVLVFKDGLFYEGAVQNIRPPDVYGVLIDNERGNRPHIYSREEILKEVIIDVKPSACKFLPEGTRICAYWSQQFSCLYPGTVAKASSNSHTEKGFINVEFDDGDSGRIPLDHIRMLTADFPVVSYDPNPLLLIGKRRRHTTTDSVEQPRKSQSSTPSTDTAPKVKRGPGRPPKIKKEEQARENDSDDDEEEEEVDVCGFDEDHDEVFTSGFSLENFRKERAKSHALSSSDKHTSKKRKEKSWGVHDTAQENKSSAKKRKERRDSSEDSDCRTSDQGKTYHSANITDRIPFVSSVRAANNQKCNGSREILSRIESESSDGDTYMESENGWQSSRLESCSFEDNSKGLEKRSKRSLSTDSKSKIAAFLPARQLWTWSGKCTKRPGLKGKAKKEFYKAIVRGKENIMVGDCAVFLSTGRPHLPYIGRIDSMWEAWGGQMVVKVKWFYHPEETRGGKKLQDMKGALFQSLHIDENDVQTISHKCEVLSFTEYCKKRKDKKKGGCGQIEEADVYYLAGTYEPTIGLLKFEKDMDIV